MAMKTWQRLKRTIKLIFKPTTRQIAAAIRLGEAKERNRAAREAPNKPYVLIDPTMRTRAYEQSAWYEPEKQTDPFAAVHQQLQHRRALMRHNTTSLAHKIHLIGADPETAMLPSVTAPEDDWTNGGIDQTIRTRAARP